MKKELKDYLYLYLNAGVSVFIFPDESITDGFLDKYRRDYPNGIYNPVLTFDNYKQFLKDGYKPILRPLSDMTGEEAIECGNMDYDFSEDPDLNKWSWKDFAMLNSSNQFLYLLSKHFDLFGLIEAGLAIDSTALKQKS